MYSNSPSKPIEVLLYDQTTLTPLGTWLYRMSPSGEVSAPTWHPLPSVSAAPGTDGHMGPNIYTGPPPPGFQPSAAVNPVHPLLIAGNEGLLGGNYYTSARSPGYLTVNNNLPLPAAPEGFLRSNLYTGPSPPSYLPTAAIANNGQPVLVTGASKPGSFPGTNVNLHSPAVTAAGLGPYIYAGPPQPGYVPWAVNNYNDTQQLLLTPQAGYMPVTVNNINVQQPAVTAGLLAPNYYTVPTTSDLLSLSSGNTAQPYELTPPQVAYIPLLNNINQQQNLGAPTEGLIVGPSYYTGPSPPGFGPLPTNTYNTSQLPLAIGSEGQLCSNYYTGLPQPGFTPTQQLPVTCSNNQPVDIEGKSTANLYTAAPPTAPDPPPSAPTAPVRPPSAPTTPILVHSGPTTPVRLPAPPTGTVPATDTINDEPPEFQDEPTSVTSSEKPVRSAAEVIAGVSFSPIEEMFRTNHVHRLSAIHDHAFLLSNNKKSTKSTSTPSSSRSSTSFGLRISSDHDDTTISPLPSSSGHRGPHPYGTSPRPRVYRGDNDLPSSENSTGTRKKRPPVKNKMLIQVKTFNNTRNFVNEKNVLPITREFIHAENGVYLIKCIKPDCNPTSWSVLAREDFLALNWAMCEKKHRFSKPGECYICVLMWDCYATLCEKVRVKEEERLKAMSKERNNKACEDPKEGNEQSRRQCIIIHSKETINNNIVFVNGIPEVSIKGLFPSPPPRSDSSDNDEQRKLSLHEDSYVFRPISPLECTPAFSIQYTTFTNNFSCRQPLCCDTPCTTSKSSTLVLDIALHSQQSGNDGSQNLLDFRDGPRLNSAFVRYQAPPDVQLRRLQELIYKAVDLDHILNSKLDVINNRML